MAIAVLSKTIKNSRPKLKFTGSYKKECKYLQIVILKLLLWIYFITIKNKYKNLKLIIVEMEAKKQMTLSSCLHTQHY